MIMHTHGLIEARDACGSSHGEARLMEAVSRPPAAGAQDPVDGVFGPHAAGSA